MKLTPVLDYLISFVNIVRWLFTDTFFILTHSHFLWMCVCVDVSQRNPLLHYLDSICPETNVNKTNKMKLKRKWMDGRTDTDIFTEFYFKWFSTPWTVTLKQRNYVYFFVWKEIKIRVRRRQRRKGDIHIVVGLLVALPICPSFLKLVKFIHCVEVALKIGFQLNLYLCEVNCMHLLNLCMWMREKWQFDGHIISDHDSVLYQ